MATLAAAAPAEQIVAERGGDVVGAVLLYPGSPFAAARAGAAAAAPPEVRLLAVAPGARGGGVGRALMRECIGRARARGAPAVTLHTTEMMRAALRLYERLGFAADPALDFHPAPGLTVKGYRLALR